MAIVADAQIRYAGRQDALSVAAVILAVGAVVLSWALVNTVFAFRYTRLYYGEPEGGIDFRQNAPPSYSDFSYMAFTLGTSFAVSNGEPSDTRIRRIFLGHACWHLPWAQGYWRSPSIWSPVSGRGEEATAHAWPKQDGGANRRGDGPSGDGARRSCAMFQVPLPGRALNCSCRGERRVGRRQRGARGVAC